MLELKSEYFQADKGYPIIDKLGTIKYLFTLNERCAVSVIRGKFTIGNSIGWEAALLLPDGVGYVEGGLSDTQVDEYIMDIPNKLLAGEL